jgi:hypothetical protein
LAGTGALGLRAIRPQAGFRLKRKAISMTQRIPSWKAGMVLRSWQVGRQVNREPALNAPVNRAVSPVLGRAAVAGMTVAVAISVDLHLRLSSQVSPVWQTLSEYVYGRFSAGSSAAPMFSAMCLALALGSLALLAGIASARRPGSAPVLVLLGVWCAGLFACATFPVDAYGGPRTLSGQVHDFGAVLAFIALPAAAWSLARRSRTGCPWEPGRTTIRRLAVASAASLEILLTGIWVINTSPSHPAITMGIFERLLFTVDLALLLTMVRPLLKCR